MRARGAIQVQYAVPRPMLPVKRTDLIAAFEAWRRGEASAIRVRVTVWGERLTEAQKRARVAQLGQLRHRPGRVERYADPRVTMCDHDGRRPELWPVWRIARQLGLRPLAIEERKTRRGWHRTVFWDRAFTPAETIALQLLLGSDWHREAFNLQRALTGTRSNRWNLLFTYKL